MGCISRRSKRGIRDQRTVTPHRSGWFGNSTSVHHVGGGEGTTNIIGNTVNRTYFSSGTSGPFGPSTASAPPAQTAYSGSAWEEGHPPEDGEDGSTAGGTEADRSSFPEIMTGIGSMIAAGVHAAVQDGIPRDTFPSATLRGDGRGGINVIGQNVRIPHEQRRAKKDGKKKRKEGRNSGQKSQESPKRRGTGGGGGALSDGSKPLPVLPLPPSTYRP
ncbi:hypothetical protein QFC21_006994 [Naganishia friedmannii]|uniref:Uncharacterized protein n=1 Tax=Naganishia friedmannii TaxID=89922 RepID=A0ACC2UYI3_9TREE|nr:hypothetical protein QFC21_006994 [Naganishia friedmannii]